MKNRIVWTDHEWDRVFEVAWEFWKFQPQAGFRPAVNEAVKRLPANRQRTVTQHVVDPIIKRIFERLRDLEETGKQVETLRKRVKTLEEELQAANQLLDNPQGMNLDQLKRPVMESMTPAEIVSCFDPNTILGLIELPDLVGGAAKRLVESWEDSQREKSRPPTNGTHGSNGTNGSLGTRGHQQTANNPVRKNRPPRVVIVGAEPKEGEIRQRLADVAEVKFPASVSQITPGDDLYVSWTAFCNHDEDAACRNASPPGRYFQYTRRGWKQLCNRIRDTLSSLDPLPR